MHIHNFGLHIQLRTSVPEHDHPLGGRTSYCYGRAYHHSSRVILMYLITTASGSFRPELSNAAFRKTCWNGKALCGVYVRLSTRWADDKRQGVTGYKRR
ncbi:jg5702 [Pararge aegeria aegeria]|uniref:Jg5702 protein n=1 Tax=Pararge aegeria aegeria TaxID=348720 RepID=A0A8S4SG57_9NEOP|nr:jg5702 [Pararge aegeria aegeria]